MDFCISLSPVPGQGTHLCMDSRVMTVPHMYTATVLQQNLETLPMLGHPTPESCGLYYACLIVHEL